MASKPILPPARRIITGHTPKGKAIIESDATFIPFDPRKLAIASSATSDVKDEEKNATGGGFILLWRTTAFAAPPQGPWEKYHGKSINLSDKVGTTARNVDMPPGLSSPMHRTVSLDFGVVIEGEVVLEVDDEMKTTVRRRETVVQRGTIHAWHNRTSEMARVLFVLLSDLIGLESVWSSWLDSDSVWIWI